MVILLHRPFSLFQKITTVKPPLTYTFVFCRSGSMPHPVKPYCSLLKMLHLRVVSIFWFSLESLLPFAPKNLADGGSRQDDCLCVLSMQTKCWNPCGKLWDGWQENWLQKKEGRLPSLIHYTTKSCHYVPQGKVAFWQFFIICRKGYKIPAYPKRPNC